MPIFAHTFPVAHNATYVKSTTESAGYEAYRATNPLLSLIGAANENNQFYSAIGGTTNQRFHIDLGTAKIIKRIYYENGHVSGGTLTNGVKTFTFWGSNVGAAFAELTYATDTDWTEIIAAHAHFEQHAAADAPDPVYVTVTNSTAYRYYAFKFADNWGGANTMILRRVILQCERFVEPVNVIHTNIGIFGGR